MTSAPVPHRDLLAEAEAVVRQIDRMDNDCDEFVCDFAFASSCNGPVEWSEKGLVCTNHGKTQETTN